MQPVLLYTRNMEAARKEIESVQGKISQQFTGALFTASFPAGVSHDKLQHATPKILGDLSYESQLAYESWKQFKQKESNRSIAADFRKGMPWDAEGFLPPGDLHHTHNVSSATIREVDFEFEAPPTSEEMVGKIAVGLVIVSGQGNLAFTRAETRKIVSEVQQGLNFLAGAEPRANISFIYDTHEIAVTANAGNTNGPDSLEFPWRNEALIKMGFNQGSGASREYVRKLRDEQQTEWAYVAYFTKYELHHYAYSRDERVVMSFSNHRWGHDSINAVFAHETCHVFGAADEYCNNCPTPPEKCLMANNDLVLCDRTRKQIGWNFPPIVN